MKFLLAPTLKKRIYGPKGPFYRTVIRNDMKTYKPPGSSYQKIQYENKSWVKTALLTLVAFPVLLFITFPLANILTYLFLELFGFNYENNVFFTDAIVSFAVLTGFYFFLYRFKSAYVNIVVAVIGVLMVVHWAVKSAFIYSGFNPDLPFWYSINVALNDLVAAALVIFIKNRITKSSKATPINGAL